MASSNGSVLDLRAAETLLSKKFIYYEGVCRVLANGIVARPHEDERPGHVLLYGPPGYGKSEMSKTFLEGINVLDDTFQLSFGEDSDEAKLLGGIDLKKFDEQKVLEYLADNSFMKKKYVIFEEFFDAPPVVLTCLKDILSSGYLRKGKQQYKVETRFIIICTNLDPHEFGQGDDARSALVQRFPLGMRVCWPNHTAADYLKLYKLLYPHATPLHEVLANINAGINEERENKNLISPRIARDGMDALIRQGRVFDREYPLSGDFDFLQNVLGYRLDATARKRIVDKNLATYGAHIKFGEFEVRFRRLAQRNAVKGIDIDEVARIGTNLDALRKDVLALTPLPTDLWERKQALLRGLHAELGEKGD